MKHPFKKSLVAAGALALVGAFVACGDDNPSNPGEGNPSSSSVVASLEGELSSGSVPASSGSVESSNSLVPGSSAAAMSSGSQPGVGSSDSQPGETPASSSTGKVELDENGFPTIESYGAPSPEYTKDISATAKRGWNTRYWDACKPHCSWLRESAMDTTRADTSSNEAFVANYGIARNCNIHDVEVPAFTLGNVNPYAFNYVGTRSACGVEKETGVFTCTDMAPIAVNDTLAYAYVAGTADSKCGKCYHLQYDGHFKHEMETNPPKATHKALKGKHLVVMPTLRQVSST